ncbi:MAG: periplasmic heavy metal sensor [Gemmatimonadetes bacterium]|nr:periplasmic heavy metal sensor [Gemmatimonadota bacterium]
MRRTRVIGIAIVSLLTVGSVAQAQNAAPGVPQARQQRVGKFEKGRGRLLRGIKLSDAEKARVKEIRGKYQTESKTLRESLRPAMQDMRTARQKHDTVAMKAAWDRTAADRQKLDALMQRERAEVRTALTPEHQTQFDANVKQLAERRAEGRKGKGHRPRRADRVGTSKS